MAVEIFSWNPHRPVLTGRVTRHLPIKRPVNNFGDLLGPIIVTAMLRERGIDPSQTIADVQLMSIGSVMHFAKPGAVVWGTGVNGKVAVHDLADRGLDVRAVRGPQTARVLRDNGIEVPAVYGDPALLLGELFPELRDRDARRSVEIVPNFNDIRAYRRYPILDPRTDVWACLERLATSELVVGSSLHAIIVAEALGVPARLIRSPVEMPLKYDDYYQGTGRPTYRAATSVDEAIALGGEPPPDWDPKPLHDAFPVDLWSS